MSNRVEKHGEKIGQDTRNLISLRYHTVTKAVNKEFWNSISDTLHMPCSSIAYQQDYIVRILF